LAGLKTCRVSPPGRELNGKEHRDRRGDIGQRLHHHPGEADRVAAQLGRALGHLGDTIDLHVTTSGQGAASAMTGILGPRMLRARGPECDITRLLASHSAPGLCRYGRLS
jgi:hypothetical protein